MKIKANARSGSVILEMEPQDEALPPVPLPELQLKKILAPVDFSNSSRKALAYAECFARQFNAELILLHVQESPPPQVEILEGALMDTTVYQAAADELAAWRREFGLRVSSKAVVRGGKSAHKEIVSAAEEGNVDLIILGNRGRTGLARAFLGSTAESVVRNAHCPVLVIREQEHDFVASESQPE